jgi:hypothetical protein
VKEAHGEADSDRGSSAAGRRGQLGHVELAEAGEDLGLGELGEAGGLGGVSGGGDGASGPDGEEDLREGPAEDGTLGAVVVGGPLPLEFLEELRRHLEDRPDHLAVGMVQLRSDDGKRLFEVADEEAHGEFRILSGQLGGAGFEAGAVLGDLGEEEGDEEEDGAGFFSGGSVGVEGADGGGDDVEGVAGGDVDLVACGDGWRNGPITKPDLVARRSRLGHSGATG